MQPVAEDFNDNDSDSDDDDDDDDDEFNKEGNNGGVVGSEETLEEDLPSDVLKVTLGVDGETAEVNGRDATIDSAAVAGMFLYQF